MDIIEIITTVLDTSALAGLAIYTIWRNEKIWKRFYDEINEIRRETATALRNNTEAMTRLATLFGAKAKPPARGQRE